MRYALFGFQFQSTKAASNSLPPYTNSLVRERGEEERGEMGSFEKQVKDRAKELKHYFNKGVKVVGNSCKKGWHKIKHIKSG